MNTEKFSNALGDINMAYIEEVINYKPTSKRKRNVLLHRKKYIAISIIILLVAFASIISLSQESKDTMFGWIRDLIKVAENIRLWLCFSKG